MRRADRLDAYLLSVLALMQVVAWTRSARLRDAVSRLAGDAAYHLSRQKAMRMEAQVTAFLGKEMTEAKNASILRESFHAFWQDTFFLAMPERNPGLVSAHGLERLAEALERGHGAILLENSLFGQRHLAKQILFAHGFAVHQVHDSNHLGGLDAPGETKARIRFVQPMFEDLEKQFVGEIIYIHDDKSLAFTRHLAEVLQNNQVLCLSGDGHSSARPIKLNFLGFERKFATGAISLARLTGAPVLPMYCWHDPGGHWQLMIEPPLSLQAGMRAYAQQLETYVRQYPEQYRGWHRAE